MNSSIFILTIIVMLISSELMLIVNSQPRQSNTNRRQQKPSGKNRPKSNKNRGRGKQQQTDDVGLWCYTCYADFERVPLTVFNPVNYIYNNPCYNPALNYTLTDNEYLTKCSSTTKYCMVDVTRMNGVLISVDRRCGQSTCRKTCLSRGYGVIRETCTFCCGGRINEDHPDYDEEVNSVYKCPNEPH